MQPDKQHRTSLPQGEYVTRSPQPRSGDAVSQRAGAPLQTGRQTAPAQAGTGRYAVYYAPESDSMLDRLGRTWLGRTAENPFEELPEPPGGFAEDEYRHMVTAPRHYGFHGTLKAPFELHPETDEAGLHAAMRDVARTAAPFETAGLRLTSLNRFLALVPVSVDQRLHKLHALCLRQLDAFRAPLEEFDYARHVAKGLSERQRRLLRRFGYPFVLEEFRFHMTLTGNMEEKARPACRSRLEECIGPYLKGPFVVREICLFRQEDRSRPFRLVERFRLRGGA